MKMEKANLEEDYLYQKFGIRNDYIYEIVFYPKLDIEGKPRYGETKKRIIGEILNFNCNQFFIKSYNEEEGNNHYILKLGNIIEIQPCISIEEYNKEIISQQFKRLQDYASLYIKDNVVIKYRSGNKQTIKLGEIFNEVTNKNKVIFENNGMISCYFKDEDKHIIKDLSIYPKIKGKVIFK
jgi:hypothetical protein